MIPFKVTKRIPSFDNCPLAKNCLAPIETTLPKEPKILTRFKSRAPTVHRLGLQRSIGELLVVYKQLKLLLLSWQ